VTRLRGICGPGGLYLATACFAAVLVALPQPSPGAHKIRAAVAPKPQTGAPAPNAAAPPPSPFGVDIDTQAKHAIVVEADTGTVLLDKFAEARIPPASMSKMMTAYVVFSLLKEDRIKLDDELPVSERAWRLGGSKMFVPLGGRIKVEDLLRGMIVQSGNDACLVLAEGIAGSEAGFVELMNQKAKEIGLADSHFADVDGLPNPDHWMTARDLATLAMRTIDDFPEYYHYYGEKDFKFNNINQGNRNPLLYKNIGVDGLKTGHTEEAGYSLTASALRDQRRVVVVLSGLPTMRARSQEGERLIEWAFREFNDYRLFGAGATVEDAEVWLGTAPRVALTVDKDFVVTLPRKLRKDMKVTLTYDRPVPAPVAKGDRLGKLAVSAPNLAPALAPVEAPLVAAQSVGRMGPLSRVAMVAGYLIWGDRH